MAKKAKWRGRLPGSKNKKRTGNGKFVTSMEVGQLRTYIGNLEDLLAKKIREQREVLTGQLAELEGYAAKTTKGRRAAMSLPRTGKRAKAKPKYQSKKTKSLKWSGRGMLPVWMREEMKGTKLRKDDFQIK